MKPLFTHKFNNFFPHFSPSIKSLTTFSPNLILSNFNSISFILSKCGRNGNIHLGSSIHASIIKSFPLYNPRNHIDPRNCVVVWNSLLGMYAKCRALRDAQKVFDEMPVRDTVSWNSMVSGFLSSGEFGVGFGFFRVMVSDLGVGQIDQASFTTVLSACDGVRFVRVCEMVHGFVILSGYDIEVTVGNALITSYFKCGCPSFARRVFDEMGVRNVVTWTAVISGLVQSGLYEGGLQVFRDMRGALVDPNSRTYSSVLTACSGLQALQEGRQIHGLVWKLGFDSELCIESALMDMYSKCRSMEDALQIFNSAEKLDEVSMTIVLVGFAQNGLEEEAIQVFLKMMRSGVDVDPNMVSAILGVFGADTSLAFGQQIHSLVFKKRFGVNPFVSNGLINMYSKCGNLEESTKVFTRMYQRNAVSWNSMIAAYARHGDGLKAIQFYEEMLSKGVKPTDITFISLLHACSHMGFVDKGMKFFESMSKVHHINPRMEHYACVVDMLGRAGLLREAKNFIDQLSVKPGILVWQALLGACAIRGDSELGKLAAEQLLLLEPDNPTPYIQLANIYSSEGKWSDRARAIMRMKEVGLPKVTGISWIEIEKKVHSFVVYDQMHPEVEVIYSVLWELYLHMEDEGYKPDERSIRYYIGQNKEDTRVEATGCT
ncbi:hypothetical protein RND81_01G117900 [Saponaria officinalis]